MTINRMIMNWMSRNRMTVKWKHINRTRQSSWNPKTDEVADFIKLDDDIYNMNWMRMEWGLASIKRMQWMSDGREYACYHRAGHTQLSVGIDAVDAG